MISIAKDLPLNLTRVGLQPWLVQGEVVPGGEVEFQPDWRALST